MTENKNNTRLCYRLKIHFVTLWRFYSDELFEGGAGSFQSESQWNRFRAPLESGFKCDTHYCYSKAFSAISYVRSTYIIVIPFIKVLVGTLQRGSTRNTLSID